MGGFIGASPTGAVTTLGYDGSDLTATLLGAALKASSVTIWTDVPGIFTCDPHIVDSSEPINEISYEDAHAFAQWGGKVIYKRTVDPLFNTNISLYIKSSIHPTMPGTHISHCAPQHKPIITYIPEVCTFNPDTFPNFRSGIDRLKMKYRCIEVAEDGRSILVFDEPHPHITQEEILELGGVIESLLVCLHVTPRMIDIIKNTKKTYVMINKTTIGALIQGEDHKALIRRLQPGVHAEDVICTA